MHNFISSDIEEFQALVRVQYARAFERFTRLSAEAAEQLSLLEFENRTAAECVAFAFWSKCVRSCQAAFLLAERGMVSDAQSSLRGAIETLFHAVALIRKPELLDRMRENDDSEKKKQIERMLKHKDISEALTNEGKARLQPLLELPGKSSFSVWDAAGAAEMSHLYETIYRTLSQIAAHSTLTSLNHELLSKAEGKPELRFGPVEDQLEWTIDLTSECLAAGMHVMQAYAVEKRNYSASGNVVKIHLKSMS